MKAKPESNAVIAGFRAVESACTWKVKVAQETAGLTVKETLKYFRAAARNLKPSGGKPPPRKLRTANTTPGTGALLVRRSSQRGAG